MSIFSILSKKANNKDRSIRSQVIDAIGSNQSLSDFVQDAGRVRNVLGLGNRVPKNTKPQFDINKFTSEISKGGLLPNNRFSVEMFPPDPVVTDNIHKSLQLRCFATQLPGKQLMVKDDIRRHGFGMIDKVPHNTMYGDVTLSFIVDSNGEIPTLFQRWMTYIHTADSRTSEEQVLEDGSPITTVDYLLRYKDEYASSIIIKQLNTNYDTAYGLELTKAFPIGIGDQQLAWDQNNSIAVLPVTFSYLDYRPA